jgi:hypothetical protein
VATILSISEIIEIGRASTYLSANYVSKQALFGGTVIKPTPPVQIAFVTDALDWGNSGGAQTEASLRSTANYLYWLCGLFQLQAQRIISGAGGGSVSPTPSGGALPNPYDFEVTVDSEPLADGEGSVTLSAFIGYNIAFNRGQVPQSTVDVGGSYYSWNRTTGLFTCTPTAVLGELFQIIPIG